MAHKYFEDQFDDEEVLFVFRKHPIIMRRGLIVISICVVLGTGVVFFYKTRRPRLFVLFWGLVGGGVVWS
jgi:hypothetical protein